jgi:hypothetical protein
MMEASGASRGHRRRGSAIELKEHVLDENGARLLSFVEILGTPPSIFDPPISAATSPPLYMIFYFHFYGACAEGCSTAEGQRVFFTTHSHAFYRSLLASVLYPCRGVSDGALLLHTHTTLM